TQYAMDQDLAGVLIWSMDTDDFHGLYQHLSGQRANLFQKERADWPFGRSGVEMIIFSKYSGKKRVQGLVWSHKLRPGTSCSISSRRGPSTVSQLSAVRQRFARGLQ
ncbi:unnamed protein product, partial [Nesidiocoris tenuis]